jgi:hypothetical protein
VPFSILHKMLLRAARVEKNKKKSRIHKIR